MPDAASRPATVTRLGVIGHAGFAVLYALSAIIGLQGESYTIVVVLPLAVLFAVLLGLGWRRVAAPYFGMAATVAGTALLIAPVVGLAMAASQLAAGGDFAGLAAVVAGGTLATAVAVVAGIAATIAFGKHLTRDGARGQVAFLGHLLTPVFILIAIFAGMSDAEGVMAVVVRLALATAAMGHAGGALTFRQLGPHPRQS